MDDVFLIPGLFNSLRDEDTYGPLQDEVCLFASHSAGSLEMLPRCSKLVGETMTHFELRPAACSCRLISLRSGSAPLVLQSEGFEALAAGSQAILFSAVNLGSPRTLLLRHIHSEATIQFLCDNGSAVHFAEGICSEWRISVCKPWRCRGERDVGLLLLLVGLQETASSETLLTSLVVASPTSCVSCQGPSDRPSMRIIALPASACAAAQHEHRHTHDDVIIVPNFFCASSDWS